jgi:hypothetical protein
MSSWCKNHINSPYPRFRFLLWFLFLLIPLVQSSITSANPLTSRVITDSLYNANHPLLLFDQSELPELRQKVHDGGYDDLAYDYIHNIVDTVYPTMTEQEMMEVTFGVNVSTNYGLVAYLEIPPDTAAYELGRRWTLFLADNYAPDDNVFYCPLRLRALTFGYDMFFHESSESLRTYVQEEIVAYLDTIMTVFQYERWLHNPYVSNISSMIGSALGLAAICLQDELNSEYVEAAIARADQFVEAWLQAHLDPEGAYNEGAMYAGWSMRNLAYYFWARKRCYDGYDYSKVTSIRNLEKWIAFSMLPQGGARVNNTNDTASLNYPLSRHHTYLDWAQNEWGSGLSAWIWERIVGPVYGYESGILADKVATVLWHQNLTPQQPDDFIPKHFLWEHRGLYYFRTGWAENGSSDDIVFSFTSGKFRGGHKHEDQNNFTLHGYSAAFAVDNGYGGPANDSEAHNMVFIDGKGQHNAGGSIGTDGEINEYLLNGFADYLLGDATAAYNSYSDYNRAGYPFPDDNWSWGYDGGNPVNFALRRIILVHDETTPPYFIILDDIEKDGQTHLYSWRMHTVDENDVDISGNPIKITGGNGYLDLHVIAPPFDTLDPNLDPFDTGNVDPNTYIISLSVEAVNPHFAFLLLPAGQSSEQPEVVQEDCAWGHAIQIRWENGLVDIFLLNRLDGHISHNVRSSNGRDISVSTDAQFVLLRLNDDNIASYLVSNACYLDIGGTQYVRINDGRLNCAMSGTNVQVDSLTSDFTFYAPNGGEVYCRDESIPVFNDGGYLIPDPSKGKVETQAPSGFLRLSSFPNPFKVSTNIVVGLEHRAPVTLTLFDIQGKHIQTIWDGMLPVGNNLFKWNGIDDDGEHMASGIYFLKARSGEYDRTTKILLLK